MELNSSQVRELFFDTLSKITFIKALPVSLDVTWSQIEGLLD